MTVTATALPPLSVRLARDHEAAAIAVPGMELGVTQVTGPPNEVAGRWFADGVRKVTMPEEVDVAATHGDPRAAAVAIRALLLVRTLTSYGVVVDWRLRLADDASDWRVYSHLWPPSQLLTAAAGTGSSTDSTVAEAGLVDWRRTYYLDKCFYRRGPGFVQIRDRRAGSLNLITIDDPAYLTVFEQLEHGAPASAVDVDIAREYEAEDLVAAFADTLLWLPYRLRRWPLPSMIV